jgi:hypothetical protein
VILRTPIGAAIFNFLGEFGEKVGNNHVATQRLSQTNLLSGNLASVPASYYGLFFAIVAVFG